MNLCIDQGNTYTKIGLFENQNLIKSLVLDVSNRQEWEVLFEQNKIDNAIVSSVKELEPKLRELLIQKSTHFLEFTHTTLLPIKNLYESPETLGKDRLAAVVGANTLHPHKNILVIDAGTAITYDFMNAKEEYLGGTIAPGLDMRFKALHSYTDKLPLVQKEGETPVLALNSEMAIRAGVVNGIVYEVEGYVNKLKETYPELLIFLTGGNCFFFESKLKKPIFANQNLVLIGLNSIIKYNAENKKN